MGFKRIAKERLVIYLSSGTFFDNRTPLYEAIFFEAKRLGIAGATVTSSMIGYGPENLIRGKTSLMPANDNPMRVEMIDDPEKLDLILPFLEKHLLKGIATRDQMDILVPDRVDEEAQKVHEILEKQKESD